MTVIVVFCIGNLAAVGVFGQEDVIILPPALEADPITLAEQALSLEDGAAGTAAPISGTSTLGILRMLLALALATAAIYGIVFFIKRLSRGNTARDPFLKVLASAPLGTNRSAHIIAVGSQAWLVGAAENGVHLISEIQDTDMLNALLLEDSRRSADSADSEQTGRFPDFRALLRRLGMPVDPNAPPSPESIRRRSERLKGS